MIIIMIGLQCRISAGKGATP